MNSPLSNSNELIPHFSIRIQTSPPPVFFNSCFAWPILHQHGDSHFVDLPHYPSSTPQDPQASVTMGRKAVEDEAASDKHFLLAVIPTTI
jgi:hypothetical protein